MKNNEYLCPSCGKKIKSSFEGPAELICTDCKNYFLKDHEQDELDNCPFCNAERDHLKYSLYVPYFYGMQGVRVHCRKCGAASGFGDIKRNTSWDCSTPPLFSRETIEDGFKQAQQKWNRRADNERRESDH